MISIVVGPAIDRPNQVCADITYIPMAKGFALSMAVMDWFSRRVLSWRLSITLETDFCVEALTEAMERHGRPDIFNTDQGVQFTSGAFLDELAARGVRISMDGKDGIWIIFIERLWRSLRCVRSLHQSSWVRRPGGALEHWRMAGVLQRTCARIRRWATGRRAKCSIFCESSEYVDNAARPRRSGVAHMLTGTSSGKGSDNVLTSIEWGLY